MVDSTITAQTSTYRVVLDLGGAPLIDIGYGESMTVTGLAVIYEDGKVAEIAYQTACGSGAHLDPDYLDMPDEWPSWLPAVIEKHRPTAGAPDAGPETPDDEPLPGLPVTCPWCHVQQSHCSLCGVDMY